VLTAKVKDVDIYMRTLLRKGLP